MLYYFHQKSVTHSRFSFCLHLLHPVNPNTSTHPFSKPTFVIVPPNSSISPWSLTKSSLLDTHPWHHCPATSHGKICNTQIGLQYPLLYLVSAEHSSTLTTAHKIGSKLHLMSFKAPFFCSSSSITTAFFQLYPLATVTFLQFFEYSGCQNFALILYYLLSLPLPGYSYTQVSMTPPCLD